MTEMNFPTSPTLGQLYTAPSGVTYSWDGYSWTIGFYDNPGQGILQVGTLLNQVRTLLQDVDNMSGQYRYSTDSIITSLNQALMDMYRIRPDLFLELAYVIPSFTVSSMEETVGIEQQYLPPLIYYVVGLTQARDDEQNQDARAMGFLKVFQQTLLTGGLT